MKPDSQDGQKSAARNDADNRSRWNTALPFAQDKYILSLLDRLSQLERDTRPSLGSKSAKKKDLAAFEALEVAGQLVAAAAGWAINHEIGLAVEGLQFAPLQPAQTKVHPRYLKLKAAVNDHRHEEVGAAARGERLSPLFLRTCLINLIKPNSGGWPVWLCRVAVDALDALEDGETYPIFKRDVRKRRLGIKQRHLILKVIGAVHFRRSAYGMSDEEARFDIAEMIGRSLNTMNSWERRLKKEAPSEVDRAIAFAKNHGSWVADAMGKKCLGEDINEKRLLDREALYGDVALTKLRKDIIVAFAKRGQRSRTRTKA
jgi:hypothetical protein